MATKPKTISERAQETSNNLPTEQQNAAPPAELMQYADEQTGLGVSTASEDRLVPLIYVLHYTSPQVMKGDSKYIPGAEPGDFWLRNAPRGLEIIKGNDGLLVQSCWFYRDVGEWLPRQDGGGGGQGFRGRHPIRRIGAWCQEASRRQAVSLDDG
jgi:hypothetical protein